jgi:hypothetical protein
LGFVRDRAYFGKHWVVGCEVLCLFCDSTGDTSLTKLITALPVIGTGPNPATVPSFSRRLEWTFNYDDNGQIVAATCEETELAEAA